ncbi:MAG: hypothetical protein AAFX78_03575 [Cyanobacteria bacterium J06638_20]
MSNFDLAALEPIITARLAPIADMGATVRWWSTELSMVGTPENPNRLVLSWIAEERSDVRGNIVQGVHSTYEVLNMEFAFERLRGDCSLTTAERKVANLLVGHQFAGQLFEWRGGRRLTPSENPPNDNRFFSIKRARTLVRWKPSS